MKACIYGAGAIGGWLGVALAQAGNPVSLVARGATLAALQADGLRLRRPEGTVAQVAVTAAADPAALGVQDLVVVAVKAPALRDVARQVPSDRLLVETDSPYLAPIPYRGKPNLPQYVREVAEYVASLRGVSYAQLAEQTTANFKRLFPLARVR